MAGSSPRLRGTFVFPVLERVQLGIIPALAGNISTIGSTVATTWDHPRACGEHVECGVRQDAVAGSSPRLRGTCVRQHWRGHRQGIIPALAGNISPRRWPWRAGRDHPRACGEHDAELVVHGGVVGSSPRLRGTYCLPYGSAGNRGIIPALAGNIYRISRRDD